MGHNGSFCTRFDRFVLGPFFLRHIKFGLRCIKFGRIIFGCWQPAARRARRTAPFSIKITALVTGERCDAVQVVNDVDAASNAEPDGS